MNVFFDVDLTLISANYELRPNTREVFTALREAGHRVFLWSMGGREFAFEMAERHELGHLIDGYFGKQDKEWPIQPDFCVDDEPHYIETYGGHLVGWYLAQNLYDNALLEVLDHVR